MSEYLADAPFLEALRVIVPALGEEDSLWEALRTVSPSIEEADCDFDFSGVHHSDEIPDAIAEALQDYCALHARPAWATGGSIIEAADLLVARALENDNI